MEIHLLEGSMLLAVLFFCTICDIRKKQIPLCPVLAAGGLLLLIRIGEGEFRILSSVLGATLGIFLLGVSKITKGAIGSGDALLFIIIGAAVGFFPSMIILFNSLLIAAVASIMLLVARKVTRKQTIPFVPFILAGYMGAWLL